MAIVKLHSQQCDARHIHYEVDSNLPPLGVGGMGQVMKGTLVNEQTGGTRPVAIKFLFEDLSENVVERARKEASIRIKNDNLVEMIDFVVTEETFNGHAFRRFHVVSELLEGVRLMDIITDEAPAITDARLRDTYEKYRNGYLNNKDKFAIDIVKGLLSGLMALHDNGYIHRDIDPSNVMLTVDGKVKLIDLGLVRSLSANQSTAHLTSMGQFVGKSAYAAPELVSGDIESQNATTDLYAVGILLFRLLTGKLPFTGTQAEVMTMQLNNKIPVKQVSNKSLRKIIEKATEKKITDRFQSASEFRVALDQIDEYPLQPENDTTNSNKLLEDILLWAGAISASCLLGVLLKLLTC